MKVVADENMPLVDELFAPFGEVRLVSGRQLTRAHVTDADVLLVRSVTAVDRCLLAGSGIRFVGSATIGTDHVDLGYLDEAGIAFASAPGCNADAVVNYVLAALSYADGDWMQKRVGIIGCGNVGGRLYRTLRRLGVSCRCYDPFLDAATQPDLSTFDEVIGAEILCLHTPLTTAGPYPTHHLFNAEVLASLAPGALLLNGGRGGAIDNRALKAELANGRLRAILDVWEGEPAIDPALLSLVELGTPHIAGYSLEGRVRGTAMIYQAFCNWLGATPKALDIAELADRLSGSAGRLLASPDAPEPLTRQILRAYNPAEDHRRLLACAAAPDGLGRCFDSLRKQYPYRREYVVGKL